MVVMKEWVQTGYVGSPLVAGISCCLFWRIFINRHYTLRVHSFLPSPHVFTLSLCLVLHGWGLGHVDRQGFYASMGNGNTRETCEEWATFYDKLSGTG